MTTTGAPSLLVNFREGKPIKPNNDPFHSPVGYSYCETRRWLTRRWHFLSILTGLWSLWILGTLGPLESPLMVLVWWWFRGCWIQFSHQNTSMLVKNLVGSSISMYQRILGRWDPDYWWNCRIWMDMGRFYYALLAAFPSGSIRHLL